MNAVIIIPARYASTRFPGKPLALLGGRPVIAHVHDRAKSTGLDTYVATDDDRIADSVRAFGGQVVMTGSHHQSGTDRIAEALSKLSTAYDVVVNIQGDEPFIRPIQIEMLTNAFNDPNVDIATLSTICRTEEEITNPNNVKVVISDIGNALYFSRSTIPFFRNQDIETWHQHQLCRKHIGIYAYRSHILKKITRLDQRPLEKAEHLEQLRWLQAGYTIRVMDTDFVNVGIDTPEDLIAAQQLLSHET